MKKLVLLPLAFAAIFFSCKKDQDVSGGAGTVYLDLPAKAYNYWGNGQNTNPELDNKATLGRVLFYDQHLSLNNSIACASCHKQANAFSDNVAFSRGYENKLTGRNSMPIENLANGGLLFTNGGMLNGTLFWDGRENDVQNLVTKPISNHVEMGIADVSVLPGKLAALPYYKDLFTNAYGDEAITIDRMTEAMFYFMTAIHADQTRFDAYQQGVGQLSALELSGMALFNNTYNCNNCHHVFGFSYSSNDFMDIGLDIAGKDKGKGAITGLSADIGRFKIPNLRNVALTAPYMHDGRFATLDQVLDHYSHNIKNDPNLDTRLKDVNGQPMRMNITTQDRQAIVAFLNTLTDYNMVTDPKFSNPFKVK